MPGNISGPGLAFGPELDPGLARARKLDQGPRKKTIAQDLIWSPGTGGSWSLIINTIHKGTVIAEPRLLRTRVPHRSQFLQLPQLPLTVIF
jgi:hypothetical protein